MYVRKHVVRLFLAVLAVGGGAGSAQAQIPARQDTAAMRRALEQQAGRQMGVDEVLERLRASGMSREQMRQQLRRMGYDESLADRYYDMMEDGRIPQGGTPELEFVAALRRMGLVRDPLASDSLAYLLPDSIRRLAADTLFGDSLLADTLATDSLEVFGRSFFEDRRSGREREPIDPMMMGPVDRGYIVGPGDELNLILTGAVELAYNLTIDRDGSVVIPQVGQVNLAGLTLDQVESRLLPELASAYRGVGREPDAMTRMNVSVGRVRAVQVYVAGDVVRPGAFQVSALSTVMDALQRAGGPTDIGTFRRVQVRRRGSPAQSVDLYDYFVRGDGSADVRLQQGDIVFVPPAGAHVRIEGEVRRPAIYEVLPDEDLGLALEYAGGIKPQAAASQIVIERILPPFARTPGVDRVVISADLVAMATGSMPAVNLEAGDRITVLPISEERRQFVSLTGAVNRPGDYQWNPGMTLAQLVEQAQGARERAYLERAHVYRLVDRDGSRTLLSVALADALNGGGSVQLAERDSIVVFSRDTLRAPEHVAISGSVKKPGRYMFAAGMSVKDLILAAGGFTEDAQQSVAHVARPTMEPGDTSAHVWEVVLAGDGGATGTDGVIPAWGPDSEEFTLRPNDEVQVLQAPGWETAREVRIAGEVARPGPYALVSRVERLSDALARAGGVTEWAYLPGIHIVRSGVVLSANAREALADRSSPSNVPLMDGDSIHVPRYDPTIRIAGAVYYAGHVAYRPGADLDYYIEQAGGYRADADRKGVSISGPDGRRQTVARGLLRSDPVPAPGSLIFVPEIAPGLEREGTNWGEVLARTAGIVSALATLLIAIGQTN